MNSILEMNTVLGDIMVSPNSLLGRGMATATLLRNALKAQPALAAAIVLLERHSRRSDVYNALWGAVFCFATLNILALAARRFEPNRRGLSFGELFAVLIVVLSIFLLGWEMLNVFHILPIKLNR